MIQVHGIGPFKVIPDDSWENADWVESRPDDRILPDAQDHDLTDGPAAGSTSEPWAS